ncbi:LD-carboxypeptidase [Neisseriaceae bacterium JH1-16]|nr:LD-carboxypeptidase [Neisseriaceae bacterium JH1-16]
MSTTPMTSRRDFLRFGTALAGLGILQGCSTAVTPTAPTIAPSSPTPPQPQNGVSLRLIAPSGPSADAAQCARALDRLNRAGFSVSNSECLLRRFQRFAGTDAERLADVNNLAGSRPAPKLILAARGGYGVMRLLPKIDYARLCPLLKESGSLLVGYSDITALQLALLAKGGVPSFAGPMAYSDFGSANPSSYTLEQFRLVTTQPGWQLRVNRPFSPTLKAEGLFWGGNLSVVAALAGTPYLPNVKGGILFLEDTGEQPYRVERMLQQLFLAGVLQQQKAILLGDFKTDKLIDYYDPGYTIGTVAAQIEQETGVPVLQGVPFGHIHDKTTLPLGVMAQLDSDVQGYTLRFGDYPTLSTEGLQFDQLRTNGATF